MPNFRKFLGVVKAGQMLHTYIGDQTDRHTYIHRVSYRTFSLREVQKMKIFKMIKKMMTMIRVVWKV